MADSREQILGKVRRSLARTDEVSAGRQAALEQRSTQPPECTRPVLDADLVAHMLDRMRAVQMTVTKVRTLGDSPAAVQRYMRQHDLGDKVVAAPALSELPWPDSLSVRFGSAEGGDRVSVTPAFAAVAETGSIVLLSGADSPTTLNFLPDDHIVILTRDQVVAYMEDVWPLLRALPDGVPRAVNFNTGPSRTADIEQTIEIGAHGPRRMHVLLVESSARTRTPSRAGLADAT